MRLRLIALICLESLLLLVALGAIAACESPAEPTDSSVGGDAGADSSAPPLDGGGDTDGSTDGAPADGAPDDSGSMGDAGGDGVPVFVAHGYAGRTAVSCDDGRTWTAERSLDDDIRCFGSSGPDCDHHAGRSKGILYSRGWFVATYGWGPPGYVERSRNGVTWERTHEGETFGGIAASPTHIMLGARNARFSSDDGASFGDESPSMLDGWNVRRAGFANHDGGRFVLVGDGGDVTLTSDEGASWWLPSDVPSSCGSGIQNRGGIAYHDGTIVIVGGDGSVCRSTDGGDTFRTHDTGASQVSSAEVVVSDGRFYVWGDGARFDSTDGMTWNRTPLSPDINVGAVERGASGTFVAVNSGWNQWYEDQRFYRSADGVTWEELPGGAYVGGHPVHQIRFGWAEPSAECPAP